MQPLVHVVVLNFNGKEEHLPVCLESLRTLSYRNLRVIMVDNGSTDGSAEYVAANFPEMEVLRNQRNIGFAESNNRGMSYALEKGADYIALLNNDTEVEPDWISAMVEAAESDGTIGACATKLLHFRHRDIIQGIGVRLNRIAIAWDYLNGRDDLEGLSIDPEVIAASGGAMLVRARALRDAGLFDPSYLFYMEDVELCLRIWDKGYRIVTTPAARAYHKFAATLGKDTYTKDFFVLRNRIRLMLRHFPARMLPASFVQALRWEFTVAKNNYWSGDNRMTAVRARALLAALRDTPKITLERMRYGPARSERIWSLLRRSITPDRVRMPVEPSHAWKAATRSEIELGTGSPQLGPGWYLMYDEGDREYRWFAREAFLSLIPPSGGARSLHVTIGNQYARLKPIELHILANECEIGRFVPESGWKSYTFPLAGSGPGPVIVTLRANDLYSADQTGELTDLSFKVKHIGIRPQAE